MRAYDTSLNGTGTTLVLSPDSEFLRFFKNAAGSGPEALPPVAPINPPTPGGPPPEATAPAPAALPTVPR